MTDRALDLSDIQGNVLGGFNTNVQILVALGASDVGSLLEAAQWVAGLAESLTTAADVRRQREDMKRNLDDSALTWLCVAVSRRCLQAKHPDLIIRDDAFNRGMLERAPSVLGDRTNPATWKLGSSAKPVDILLIVASNHRVAAERRADDLTAAATAAGLVLSHCETCERLPQDREHFGFRDGISQPLVLGFDAAAPAGLGAGDFVFGYPSAGGGSPVRPYRDERDVADNGSLLVLRRLEQNVAAFAAFADSEAAKLRSQGWSSINARQLQALLVGRWPSGALASVDCDQDPGQLPNNEFDFSDDPSGLKCPGGAHIRKVNPRSGAKDRVEIPRILRRGIPFGRPFADDPNGVRGLNFVSFQTSIERQFEFLVQHWMNSRDKPARGEDLLAGRDQAARSLTIRCAHGDFTVSSGGRQWITPTGGAYLFAPGRAGLRKLGA